MLAIFSATLLLSQYQTSAQQQLLLVLTQDWSATDAVAQNFVRDDDKNWTSAGSSHAAVVGKKGLGWGDGQPMRSEAAPDEPIKREGDLKSPAGIFSIDFAFGRKSASDVKGKLDYLTLNPTTECVDDGASFYYNTVVDKNRVQQPDWQSSEKMFFEPLYWIGAFVGHNKNNVSGAGSCIFLHVWSRPSQGTAGCTAFEREVIESYIDWFDAGKNPIMVQLPIGAYKRLKDKWELP